MSVRPNRRDFNGLPINQYHEFDNNSESLSDIYSLSGLISNPHRTLLDNNEVTHLDDNPPSEIIFTGKRGSGISYLANLLTESDTSVFEESNTVESESKTINSALSWNGKDMLSEVPAYFDYEDAHFVDYLMGKWVKAIVLVVTDRIDAYIKNALNNIRDSDLKHNVILVINKDFCNNRPDDTTTYEEFSVVYVKAYQTNLDVLKRTIDSMIPTYVTNPPISISLFKQPINIIHDDIDEFHKHIDIPETEILRSTTTIPSHDEIECNGCFPLCSFKSIKLSNRQVITVTDTTEKTMNRQYAEYHRYKVSYAERIDGKFSFYRKEPLDVIRIPVRENPGNDI
mmetsp:Transcript_7797/g.6968  ORF Transcript_7797/g.6968 Transcript_7797/m.6968 type:complete len:341 (-) Transcript_7797:7-1029(-)